MIHTTAISYNAPIAFLKGYSNQSELREKRELKLYSEYEIKNGDEIQVQSWNPQTQIHETFLTYKVANVLDKKDGSCGYKFHYHIKY